MNSSPLRPFSSDPVVSSNFHTMHSSSSPTLERNHNENDSKGSEGVPAILGFSSPIVDSHPILDWTNEDSAPAALMCLTPKQRDLLDHLNRFVAASATSSIPLDHNAMTIQFLKSESASLIDDTISELQNCGDAGQALLEKISANTTLFKLRVLVRRAIDEITSDSPQPPDCSKRESSSSKPNNLLLIPVESRQLATYRKVLENLTQQLKAQLELQAHLPLKAWIKEALMVPPQASTKFIPIAFNGIWTEVPKPDCVDSWLWPPRLWKCFAWSKLVDDFFGTGTAASVKSLRLEGSTPIEVMDQFVKGDAKRLRITPESFLQEVISQVHRWMNPKLPGSSQKSKFIVERLREIEDKPITPLEVQRAAKAFEKMHSNKDISDEELKEMVCLQRANFLAKHHPCITLLAASTTQRATGLVFATQKYLSEMFSREDDPNSRHLYCSQVDHDLGIRVSMKLPDESSSFFRVTQSTRYHVHPHPYQTDDGCNSLAIATFNMRWTVGVPQKGMGASRWLRLKVTELRITSDEIEDRQLIPFLFHKAQRRYDLEPTIQPGKSF